MPPAVQAGSGAWLDPHLLAHLAGVGRVGDADAVLEAHPVPRNAYRSRGETEAVDAPPDPHGSGGVGQDVEHGVPDHVAVSGAQLHQQVTVADRRVQVVVEEGAHRLELGRLAGTQPVAAVEERRAQRHGDREIVR